MNTLAENNSPNEEDTPENSNNQERVLSPNDPIIPPEKFDWANKWLKGDEYAFILKNIDVYNEEYGLSKLPKKTHPESIYTDPQNGLVYFVEGNSVGSEFGFPRVEKKKHYRWKKMNFTTHLPKKNPFVTYIVASAVKCEKFFPNSKNEGPSYRMHAVILHKPEIDPDQTQQQTKEQYIYSKDKKEYILCHIRKIDQFYKNTTRSNGDHTSGKTQQQENPQQQQINMQQLYQQQLSQIEKQFQQQMWRGFSQFQNVGQGNAQNFYQFHQKYMMEMMKQQFQQQYQDQKSPQLQGMKYENNMLKFPFLSNPFGDYFRYMDPQQFQKNCEPLLQYDSQNIYNSNNNNQQKVLNEKYQNNISTQDKKKQKSNTHQKKQQKIKQKDTQKQINQEKINSPVIQQDQIMEDESLTLKNQQQLQENQKKENQFKYNIDNQSQKQQDQYYQQLEQHQQQQFQDIYSSPKKVKLDDEMIDKCKYNKNEKKQEAQQQQQLQQQLPLLEKNGQSNNSSTTDMEQEDDINYHKLFNMILTFQNTNVFQTTKNQQQGIKGQQEQEQLQQYQK